MNAEIENYLPHRGEMRLVHRLLAADDESVCVEADVPAEGRFVRDGRMPAFVGIELMAQAVAAWAGARARRSGSAPKVGFLLGSRRYEACCDGFDAGTTLQVHARCELMGDNGLGMFDCRIEHEGRALATARVSVYETADSQAAGVQR